MKSLELIGASLTRLAIARGASLDESIAVVYLTDLADLDPALVARACGVLAKLKREDYETALPSVGTIREHVEALSRDDARAQARQQLLPMPLEVADSRTWVHCRHCNDEPSGHRLFWCEGTGEYRDHAKPCPLDTPLSAITHQQCARRHPHMPHTYADRCACLPTNPAIARKRDAARTKAA